MIRELINILSVCDDWTLERFNRNDGRSAGLHTNEEAALPSLMREFVTLGVRFRV